MVTIATLLAPQDSVNMAQAQWQEMEGGKWTNGVLNGQLNNYVVTTTSGLGISVASGKALLVGFLARSDAAVALTAATADPTNPRIDRAILHADLTAHTLTVQLLTGTPAPSPTPPALTQTSTVWEISLYQVRVNAASATITSLTDERVYSAPGNAVAKTGDTMTGTLALPQAIFTATLSAANILMNWMQSYALFSDNVGTLGTTRTWWEGPDRGEAHIGPRNVSNFFDWIRLRATKLTVNLGKNTSPNSTLFEVTGGPTQLDNNTISTDGAGHLTAVGFIGPLTGTASQVPAAGVQAGTLGGSVALTKISSDAAAVASDGAGNLAATTLKDGGSRVAVTGAGSVWATQAVIGIGDLAHRPAAGVKGRIYIQTPFS